jgi:hypothetical protein
LRNFQRKGTYWKSLLNEGELNTGGVCKSEEILPSEMPANPKVLNGGMDVEVGVAVRHRLPPTKVFSKNVD